MEREGFGGGGGERMSVFSVMVVVGEFWWCCRGVSARGVTWGGVVSGGEHSFGGVVGVGFRDIERCLGGWEECGVWEERDTI